MDSPQKEIQEDDEPLQHLLRELKSLNMLHSVDMLRQLCHHVEQESSPLVQNSLETCLQHLVADLKRWRMEHQNLEEALKLKDDEHETQVRILFEEMETERREDKKNQMQQEEHRLRLKLSTVEQDLVDKERQLQDAVSRQQELMERVNLLRNKELHAKEENERLLKAKEELEAQLQAERREVTQVQRFLDDVRQNEAWERHKHLSTGFVLAKRIMLEQQGLLHQLQLLQQMTSTLEGGRGEEEEEEEEETNLHNACAFVRQEYDELKKKPLCEGSKTEIKSDDALRKKRSVR